jgi:hypothetical protein
MDAFPNSSRGKTTVGAEIGDVHVTETRARPQ